MKWIYRRKSSLKELKIVQFITFTLCWGSSFRLKNDLARLKWIFSSFITVYKRVNLELFVKTFLWIWMIHLNLVLPSVVFKLFLNLFWVQHWIIIPTQIEIFWTIVLYFNFIKKYLLFLIHSFFFSTSLKIVAKNFLIILK